MYRIEYAPQAVDDLHWFSKRRQKEILVGIQTNLRHEPSVETRDRKRLRPNDTAAWELRIGECRVLYDAVVTIRVVQIRRIGRKRRNRILFRGGEEDV